MPIDDALPLFLAAEPVSHYAMPPLAHWLPPKGDGNFEAASPQCRFKKNYNYGL